MIMDWYFSQMKGTSDEEINEADIISCLEFDCTGEFVATGDKCGRVVVFKRNHNTDGRLVDYIVHCTFTSHEPEFDYLKSLEIEEKINKIKWLPQGNDARFMLSTNDKTIKLWRIAERQKRPMGFNFAGNANFSSSASLTEEEKRKLCFPTYITSPNELRIPYYQLTDTVVEATPRRIFANAHAYHINSISINSDQETFLSSDDLRINIWNLQLTNQSFNIVDIKPTNMEDLTEVITTAQFHPTSCSLLIYSSSKGTIRLCDMRERALCDNNALVFEEADDSTSRSFFSEIISSISDINFSHSGRYILSRDYLTLKVWDMNMAKSPIATYPVHDYLRMKLCALYENDCIFDKFECCWSPDDKYMMTGSYNNFFRIFDRDTNKDVTMEVNRDLIMSDRPLVPRVISAEGGHQRRRDEISVDCMDFQRRLLHLAWHPQQNILAIAATNNLFVLESRGLKISPNQFCSSQSDHNTTTRSGASESINSMTTCSTSGYSSSLIVPSTSDDRMELD